MPPPGFVWLRQVRSRALPLLVSITALYHDRRGCQPSRAPVRERGHHHIRIIAMRSRPYPFHFSANGYDLHMTV
jgi:hypothetical protein